MDADEGTELEVLSEEECLGLLGESYVGRVGFIVEGRPLVLPVNYLLRDRSVVFASGEGTKLRAIRQHPDVAFEIDFSRPLFHSGWSVLVVGLATVIEDPDELARLENGPLRPWARGARTHWVRIEIERVSGRRVPSA